MAGNGPGPQRWTAMNVVVCVKQIPDPAAPASLDPGTNTLDRSGKLIMDDSDNYGVEMALQLASGDGDEVILVSMAPGGETSGLRTGLAMGAAKAIPVSGGSVKVERQTEAGYDEVVVPLPAVVTVTAGVVEPRYPSFKGIMAAKSKPVDNLTVADLGIDASQVGAAGAGQEIIDVSPAEERGGGEIVVDEGDGAERVVAFLEQLKVV